MEIRDLSFEELEQVAGGKVIWIKTPNGTIPIHIFKEPQPIPTGDGVQVG